MTLPNLITLARLAAVPVLVLLIVNGADAAAFALFVAAGASDALDGAIARAFPGQASALGRRLDPAADKLLLAAVFLALTLAGSLPLWLTALVIGRDVLIVAAVAASAALGRPVAIEPLLVSKVNTAAQVTLAALVLAEAAFAWTLKPGVVVLVWSVAALTAASAAAYLVGWIRHLAEPSPS